MIVSTDVAARGIHIKRLKYVVNYDFPPNIEQYCHRIGRCGRQGESGEAYSLLTRNFAAMASDLVELLKACNQEREPNLERLATQFALGEVEVNEEDEGEDEEGEEEEEATNEEEAEE
jgi:ATP-dependent RNA helicase DDX5/DBP2